MEKTPKQLGFYMPAEWEQHSAVWLAWPYDETTFPNRIAAAEEIFTQIIAAIHATEQVNLIVLNPEMQQHAAGLLKQKNIDLSKVTFQVTKFGDVWTRDYGPTFLLNKENKSLGWVKWDYNAYGKADDPYFAPVLVDKDVFNNLEIPGQKFQPGIVMEGGSIDANGQGTLLTTEQCLLNPNRNPHLNKEQIEQYLKDYLGINKIIWLKQGLVNDHTDGHIDDIAKFVGSNKILAAYEEDKNDENYKILDQNYQMLKNSTDANGQPFEVIKMPMPHMIYEVGHSVHSEGIDDSASQTEQAEKAAVSYVNSYVGNQIVLLTTFNDPNDAKAMEIMQNCFPDRKLVGINCSDIIYGGGAIHCMTQQQPLT